MQQFFLDMGYEEWFGLSSLVAVLILGIVTAIFTYFSAKKAGLQKIAEARLDWSNQYKDLSLRLDRELMFLERDLRRKRSFVIDRRRLEVRQIVTEMLYMVNPESDDEAGNDERVMEVQTLTRLARVGVSVDMQFVEMHRKVLKHNWRRAKSEF